VIRFVLIREGKADAGLVSVLRRLCMSLGVTSIQGADGAGLGVGRRVADQVRAALELDPDLDLVFAHMDADNEGLELRRERLRTALTTCPRPYARVVPVRATESWLLIDAQRIRDVVGHPDGEAPLGLPKLAQIEDAGRPKERLREALSRAQRPRKHQKREVVPISDDDYTRLRSELLESLDIAGDINQLSAWQALVTDTKAALAQISEQP
jgi:hypothetical protein